MSAQNEIQVVSAVRQKQNGGTFSDPVPLGVEQRFVGALRHTSLNNIEEQYLLGTDEVTTITETTLNNIKITNVRAEYTDDVTSNNYYILDTEIYDLEDVIKHQTGSAYLEGILINFTPNSVAIENQSSVSSAYAAYVKQAIKDLIGDDFLILLSDDKMMISPTLSLRKDVLKFKDDNGIEVNVATKNTVVKIVQDPNTGVISKVITRTIINHLK